MTPSDFDSQAGMSLEAADRRPAWICRLGGELNEFEMVL